MTGPASRRREPVSIICVFNDARVREICLDRSIEAQRESALDVDFVAVDNIGNPFASAGAALNHGASLARNDYLVFVHQDVYLHSIRALEEAAGRLADSSIGILGAVGIRADGSIVGRMRDRVVLIGESATEPVDVDSLDEVLFMIPRRVWDTERLTEQPELAWHAYAVEYGIRMRERNLRTVALDLPITHNSLTVNLDKLDVAHGAVAQRYPHAVPVRTTCGTVRDGVHAIRRSPLLAPHLWRRRWLRDSLITGRARRAGGRTPFVLGDIRLDVDDLLRGLPDARLEIVNVVAQAAFGEDGQAPLVLPRRDREVTVRAASAGVARDVVAGRDPDGSVLVTNLDAGGLEQFRATANGGPILFGYHEAMGYWLLVGPVTALVPRQWTSRAARPLGTASLAG